MSTSGEYQPHAPQPSDVNVRSASGHSVDTLVTGSPVVKSVADFRVMYIPPPTREKENRWVEKYPLPSHVHATNGAAMSKITYDIIEHDGGWAFKLGDTISETFPSHAAALAAAKRVALEQQVAGEDTGISWEDKKGRWHDEVSDGEDRPEVEIHDKK